MYQNVALVSQHSELNLGFGCMETQRGEYCFTRELVDHLTEMRWIVDARGGGLVQGSCYADGGIKVLKETEGLFLIGTEAEGWEFVVNPYASMKFNDQLRKMDREFCFKTDWFEPYDYSDAIPTLDARCFIKNRNSQGAMLTMGSHFQWIINKHSTKKYLKELIEINNHKPS